MSTRRMAAAVGAVLLVGVLAGGCRADLAAPTAPSASTVDPLGGVDATLDAIERDLDTDDR